MHDPKLYKLIEDVYIPLFEPLIFIKSTNCIVVADLHLGIEGALEKQGVFLPLNISLRVIESLERTIEEVDPERVIFLGDVKHEFGFPIPSEWINVRKMLEWLLDRELRVEVVRGNHDNYLIAILKRYGIPLCQDVLEVGRYSLTHGHLPMKFETLNDVTIMGHEHPSIRIRDEAGVPHKFKCFLVGGINGKKLIVLPSFNELASGTDVNLASKDDFLSPVLREVDLGEFTPYLIHVGRIVEKFPKLSMLRINSFPSP